MSSDEACPVEEVLVDVAAGRADLANDPALVHHLARCEGCRAAVALLARDEASAHEATTRDPLAEAALGAGDVVGGRYRLVRLVGAGAMGAVWEADDARSGTRVALKMLRRFHEAALRRQRREAAIAWSLRHPNIVPLLDVVDDDGRHGPALVMPLLDGETFDALLVREGRLGVARAADLLVPVLDALAHAHAMGVVHRDVKPQNLFVAEGRVHVLDFGIAKVDDDGSPAGSRITRTGEVLGTPRYMAPEQIFGERDVDARADVWAAGVIVYRALSAELPIAARTLGETMKAHARGTIVPLSERVPHLDGRVMEAVTACLARDRERRSGSTIPLRDALRSAADAADPFSDGE